MSLMGCLGCPAVYEVGLPRCPECGSWSPMYAGVRGVGQVPTTTSGGASNAWETSAVAEEAAAASEAPAQDAPVEVRGEDGPELVVTPRGDGGALVFPEGWTADPGPGVEAPADEPEVLSDADVAAGYTDFSFAQLRAEAKARGLPAGGSAVDLAARLGEHDAASAPATAAEGDVAAAGG